MESRWGNGKRRSRRFGLAATLLTAGVGLAGCGAGIQSVLDPAGIQAERISTLWWPMFAVLGAVLLLVLLFLWWSLIRAPRLERPDAPRISPAEDSRVWKGVGAAIVVSVVTLFALLVASLVTGARLAPLPPGEAITIEVIGHQWWWEVRYLDDRPERIVTTANEIHLPVGVPVIVKSTSRDVIHSYWVPNLHGKRDMLPGRITEFWLQADRPGVYRGQCTEFCGLQHALMAFHVVAEPKAEFEAWLEAQRKPAAEPQTEIQGRGRDVFLASRCVECHTVRGTPARERHGPDLTHVASRKYIAAGTLPNTRGHLAGWIADPQALKPGTQMPANPLPAKDMQALLEYLENLR